MKCIHCNCELPDDSLFCFNCGQSVTPAPTYEPVPAAPVFTPAPPVPPAPEPKPKKSRKWILFAGIGVAVVAVILIILFATGVLGGKTYPQEGLKNVIKNGNFTIDAKAMGSKMNIQVDIDWKKEDITVYAEQDGEFTFAIYDEYYITESYYGYYATDISEEIESFFDNYDPDESIDLSSVLLIFFASTNGSSSDIDDYIDTKQLEKCMDTLANKLKNKSWLKKNAGYSTEKEDGVTMHIYEPELTQFASAVLEIFRPCFQDPDDYEYLLEMLEDYEDQLDAMNVKLSLGVKGKYLVSAEAKISGMKIKAAIEDIGSTRIDTDDLKDMLYDAIH